MKWFWSRNFRCKVGKLRCFVFCFMVSGFWGRCRGCGYRLVVDWLWGRFRCLIYRLWCRFRFFIDGRRSWRFLSSLNYWFLNIFDWGWWFVNKFDRCRWARSVDWPTWPMRRPAPEKAEK